jgi:hypothetical protein
VKNPNEAEATPVLFVGAHKNLKNKQKNFHILLKHRTEETEHTQCQNFEAAYGLS